MAERAWQTSPDCSVLRSERSGDRKVAESGTELYASKLFRF